MSKEQQDAINKLGEAFDDIEARQTSVPELTEVDCCARCDHFNFSIETLDRATFECTLHAKKARWLKKIVDVPIDIEPFNLCKDFADEE